MGLIHLGLWALVPLSVLVGIVSAVPALNLNDVITKRGSQAETTETVETTESVVWRPPYLEVDEEDENEEEDESDHYHWWGHKSYNSRNWDDDLVQLDEHLRAHFKWDVDTKESWSDSGSGSDSSASSGSGSDSGPESEHESWRNTNNNYERYDYENNNKNNDEEQDYLKPDWTEPSASMTNLVLHRGIGTVYSAKGRPGSCGITHGDDAYIVALGNSFMNWEYKSSHCGRRIRAKNVGANYRVGGKGNAIEVVVADTCASCRGNHIDFSHAAWDALTDYSTHGQINLEWAFLD
ncbi:hypothetical protein QBC43DRAFT_330622 [Cladorrhinum sp. PSN259]|nr:hypothetical protein QBC43DRAFT_330622 [Cladorrhinum sp. PSN259]